MQYLIGDIAKTTGFGIHTLRFYEKKALIEPKRDARNRRVYSEGDLFRLQIIKNFKKIGTSLDDIELYFHYFDDPNEGKTDRKKFLLAEKERIHAQVEHLKLAEKFIDDILVKCHFVD